MKNAVFMIPKPALLVEAIKIIEEIFEEIEKDTTVGEQTFQDIQGDVYEMLLSEIARLIVDYWGKRSCIAMFD